jgi:molecular chaperone IbpA
MGLTTVNSLFKEKQMFRSPLTQSLIRNNNNPIKYEVYNTLGTVENFFNQFDKIQDAVGGNYPPYNVVSLKDGTRQIQLALAGWKTEDIEVSLDQNLLNVEGKRPESSFEEIEYLHRGIGLRNFTRQWTLSNLMSVDKVEFLDGLLKITLSIAEPESQKKLLPIT